jgi:hypothetical protein
MDVRIAHTVAYLLRCPWLSVPEAMRACTFTLDESASRSKQMVIRRSFAKSTGGKLVPPPDVIDVATAATTTVLPLTNQMSAEKVAKWREIRAASTEPPMVDVWTAEDEEELVKISNKEIDMSETYLSMYAALQKRNAVAAVLGFTDKEWESLKALREADGAERNQVAMANNVDDIIVALGTEHEMAGGTIDEEVV